MANKRISDLNPLLASSASINDLTVVVDVLSDTTPTGEDKKMTLGELSNFVFDTVPHVSSSNQLDINELQNYPLSASHGGTGVTYIPTFSVLVGQGTSSITFATGNIGNLLGWGLNGPTFVSGVISSSAQVDYNYLQNKPQGVISSSDQLPNGLYSSSAQVSFLGLSDTPKTYVTNSFIKVNSSGSGLDFFSLPISVQDLQKGKSYANGVYYFNGDIRERLYANIQPQTIYSGGLATYYQDFLHSGNVCLDKFNRNLYFVRGTWPRRKGLNSSDYHGLSWREANNTIDSRAEAVCSTREDGQNFQVLADFWTSTIGGSLPNSVKNSSGKYVVSEPSAVAFDSSSNSIFVACRNDHCPSIIYKMNATGSQSSIENSTQVWVTLANGDLKIDCVEVGVIPKGFYYQGDESLNPLTDPPQNTPYLFFGVSPDWNTPYASGSTLKHAAIYKVPTSGTAPGTFLTDYPVAYTLHRFWRAGTDATNPDMGTTGVKSIKLYIARAGQDGGEWNPYSDTLPFVRKDKSRLFVVHSGAPSQQLISHITGSTTFSRRTITSASFYPTVPQTQPSQTSPLVSGSMWSTASQTVYPILVPQPGPTIPAPLASLITSTNPFLFNNNQFGGHGIFELLIGNTGSILGNPYTGSFSSQIDLNRPWKTWRQGYVSAVSGTLALYFSNISDDPGSPIGETGSSAPGAPRNRSFAINDRLFLLTAPSDFVNFDSTSSFFTQSRGIVKIGDVSCGVNPNTPRYFLNGTYTDPNEEGNVMVIPVLANSINNENTAIMDGGQQGLQQMTIDPYGETAYVADFFFSRYYTTYLTSSYNNGAQDTYPYASTPTPVTIYSPAETIPTNSSVPSGYINYNNGNNLTPSEIDWPTAPIYPGAPTGPSAASAAGYTAEGWPNGPTQVTYSGQNNAPVPITASNNYSGPFGAYYFTPTYYPKATFPPTPNNPNPALPGYGQAASGSYPAGPAPLDAYTDNTFNSIYSEFGTIYEANLWTYSHGTNGQRIFDNANPQIAYSRPCGLTGYNEGPNKVYRLLYTNGENNFVLNNNNLGMGIYINGFSRTFTQDGVLAQGHNVLSISDKGAGIQGGLVVTMQQPTNTSDYVVIAQGSDGEFFGSGQQHHENPITYTGSIDSLDAQSDASLYFGKNRSQFRLTYTGSLNLDVLYFSVIGGELGPIF